MSVFGVKFCFCKKFNIHICCLENQMKKKNNFFNVNVRICIALHTYMVQTNIYRDPEKKDMFKTQLLQHYFVHYIQWYN